jgi:hypothetical protein
MAPSSPGNIPPGFTGNASAGLQNAHQPLDQILICRQQQHISAPEPLVLAPWRFALMPPILCIGKTDRFLELHHGLMSIDNHSSLFTFTSIAARHNPWRFGGFAIASGKWEP